MKGKHKPATVDGPLPGTRFLGRLPLDSWRHHDPSHPEHIVADAGMPPLVGVMLNLSIICFPGGTQVLVGVRVE